MDSCCKSLRDSSPFDCLLFDLDETLYPSALGIGQATKRNIDGHGLSAVHRKLRGRSSSDRNSPPQVADFLVEKCGFPVTQAPTLRVELFKTYGSSLAGLRLLGYDIDADDYHSFVHGRLPYESIKPDPQLRNLLRSINQRKIIFTNSDRNHAMKALDRLGIRDCFEKIICFETLNPNLSKSTRPDEFPVVLKPSLEAFRIAIDVAEIDPCCTLFLDDSLRNVAAGKALGLRTAMVGKSGKFKEADYALENINSLAQAIPEIWFGEGENEDQRLSRTRSQIDPVLATASVGA